MPALIHGRDVTRGKIFFFFFTKDGVKSKQTGVFDEWDPNTMTNRGSDLVETGTAAPHEQCHGMSQSESHTVKRTGLNTQH